MASEDQEGRVPHVRGPRNRGRSRRTTSRREGGTQVSQRGSVQKRGDTWTAYWFTVCPGGMTHQRAFEPCPGGERLQRTKGGFRTKKDGQGHLTTVLSSLQTGTYVEPAKVTFKEFV